MQAWCLGHFQPHSLVLLLATFPAVSLAAAAAAATGPLATVILREDVNGSEAGRQVRGTYRHVWEELCMWRCGQGSAEALPNTRTTWGGLLRAHKPCSTGRAYKLEAVHGPTYMFDAGYALTWQHWAGNHLKTLLMAA